MSKTYYLGADLGGTSLRMGAVSATGDMLGEVLSVRTGKSFGADQLQQQVRGLVQRVRQGVPEGVCGGVGFGTAGIVHDDAPLSHADNLPGLVGTRLRPLLEEAMG